MLVRAGHTEAAVDITRLPAMYELRDYGVGAQVLAELGIQDMFC